MKFFNKISMQTFIIISMIMLNLIMNNKMFLWMTLEVSTLSYISMMILSKSMNSSIIYFIISFISSTILFLGLLYYPWMDINIFIMMSILIKIGIFPFNYWFNLMSKMISFTNLSVLMTLMKFIPLNILHLTTEMSIVMLPVILASMILSPIMSINKYSIKLILSYSSIHQTSLMMIIMYMNFNMFIMYFTLYTLMTMGLMNMLNNMSMNLKYEIIMNKKMKTMFFLMMISYSYFPPMATFIMKWTVIENMLLMNNLFKMITVIVMLSSFIMIWSYLNFMNTNIYNYNNFNKMFMKKSPQNLEKELLMLWMLIMGSLIYMYFNF